jgi:hypothetical protein
MLPNHLLNTGSTNNIEYCEDEMETYSILDKHSDGFSPMPKTPYSHMFATPGSINESTNLIDNSKKLPPIF